MNEMKSMLFSILRAVIHDNPMREKDKLLITDALLAEEIKLASKHDIAHLVAAYALNNGLEDGASKSQMQQIAYRAVYRYENLNYELHQIYETLEKSKIPFIPLKGSVLRKYYPKPWMRTSCDIDILVHETDLEKAISALVAENKYTVAEKKNYHDISLYSPSGVHLELHFNIREDIKRLDDVLDKVWQYATASDEMEYKYELTNEFLLFHIIAHMSYHFVSGGCGVRPFMDIWLLNRAVNINKAVLDAMLQSANLEKFYACVWLLSAVWFDGESHTEVTKQMESYILHGGVYGTMKNKVTLQQQRKKGKYAYMFRRIFLPYNKLKNLYPIIKQHRWLTPIVQVHRWYRIVFRGRAGRAIREFSYNQSVTKPEQEAMKQFLSEIGL